MESKQTNFLKNLRFVLAQFSSEQDETFATRIRVSQTTVYRWLTGKTTPNSSAKNKIAVLAGMDVSEFDLAHEQFVSIYKSKLGGHPFITTPNVSLNIIEKWRQSAGDATKNLGGCYLVSYRHFTVDQPYFLEKRDNRVQLDDHYVKALLNIFVDETSHAMKFSFTEASDANGRKMISQYNGAAYLISEYLFFLGEEIQSNSTITMHVSKPTSDPPAMTGHIVIGGNVQGHKACQAGPVNLKRLGSTPQSYDQHIEKGLHSIGRLQTH